MFLDGKDFKTIWQLAHNWVGVDPDKTDAHGISAELKDVIHRLMLSSFNEEISIRTRRWTIFDNGYYLNTIIDYAHFRKFKQCLREDKFDKPYLDSLYVKRNEVLSWCANIVYLDPPPCWTPKKLSTTEHTSVETVDPDDESNGWYDKITKRRRERVVCIELAKQLWQLYPGMSYEEMHKHPTMEQLGYSSTFSFKSFKNLVRFVASEPAQLPGSPIKSKE